MRMESQVRVTAVLETGAMGWLDTVLIAVWRGSSPESADVFYREMKTAVMRGATGIGHLAVIEPGAPLPDPYSRSRIASIFDECPEAMSAVSVVFEGTGFFAAAVGSVATGIMFLSGRRTPFKIATTLPEGALFLGRHVPSPDFSVRGCLDAVGLLRQRMNGRPSFLPDAPAIEPPRSSVPTPR